MKIKSISPVCVHIPTRIGNELYQYNFIKIQTEEGMVGWGEAFGYISWKPVKVAIEEMIIPFLKGKEINTVNDILKISNEIQKKLHIFGRYGITIYALSGVEIGLWDALGKEKKLPICKMLGNKNKDEFFAYASLLRYSDKKKLKINAMKF